MAAIIPISTLITLMRDRNHFFLFGVTFSSWPGKFVIPNFRQYQSYRSNDKFNCCLEIKSKMAARVSVCTLNPLNLLANQAHI